MFAGVQTTAAAWDTLATRGRIVAASGREAA
jgi:hypothetical protein